MIFVRIARRRRQEQGDIELDESESSEDETLKARAGRSLILEISCV